MAGAAPRRAGGLSAPKTPADALVDLPLAARPVGLAQLELLELAGRRTGQSLAELDRGRALVVRHAAAAVGDQVAGAHLIPRTQHDQRLDRLAPLLVGHTDHGGLGYRRVLVEAVLDLDGRDVLTTGDDHVLLPVGDHGVSVLGVAAVAGVEPAVDDGLDGLIRLVPVALEDVVGAREDLAVLVDGHAHADRRHARARKAPGSLRAVQPVPFLGRAIDREQGRGLGEAVDLDELPAQLALDTLDRLRRRRRAGDQG